MRKCVLCLLMTLVIIGCRKKETLGEEAVRRQHAIVWAEMESETGVWSERAGNWSSMGSAVLDIDGDGIKEILLYIGYHWETKWWLWYYKDGKWHEVSDTPFMYAHEWDTYYRTNDVKNLPRFFRQSGGSIEAIIFDKEKGTVTLEPFDGQKFEELQKQGVLL